MPHQLEFDIEYRYASIKGGIWIPAILSAGADSTGVEAKVDTGCEYCVFQREVADQLGLEVESGYRLRLGSPGGDVETYTHLIRLETLGLSFDSVVCFRADYGFTRNLLGRNGWLNQVKLAVIDYEETLFISPYNQPQ